MLEFAVIFFRPRITAYDGVARGVRRLAFTIFFPLTRSVIRNSNNKANV